METHVFSEHFIPYSSSHAPLQSETESDQIMVGRAQSENHFLLIQEPLGQS